MAQMKDQVMTINSVQDSSKWKLSSGTFGPFKVDDHQVLQRPKRLSPSVATTKKTITKCCKLQVFGHNITWMTLLIFFASKTFQRVFHDLATLVSIHSLLLALTFLLFFS